ncbi:MAG: hypothetical protein FJ197_11680 [Gammaproteobacteria bacterium]|nr:hypothetical protein [Gammaproteobacteria bacterium]
MARDSRMPGAAALGWIVMLLYTVHTWISVRMPRIEKSSLLREELRGWHYLLGMLLFVALALRLWHALRDRPPPAAAGMTLAGHDWARRLATSFYLILFVMPVIGIGQAWTDGLTVHVGPFFDLPAWVEESRSGWMLTGYFHSAFGFAAVYLTFVGLATAAWFWIRRGVGPIAAFPPGFGAQLWVVGLLTIYAFSTFDEKASPWPAIGGYLGLTALVWGAGFVLGRGRAQRLSSGVPVGAVARWGGIATILAVVGIASYGPFAMFGVAPWAITDEIIVAPESVRSHAAPVMAVQVSPETEFERQVKEETYKWCRFCHTVAQNDKHLAGPNLYAIFGQQAATVPNFSYSEALAARGRAGLKWDEAALDAFIAAPGDFVPGTSMKPSMGPITDPATRAAIINILKRETMPASP